MKLEDSNSTYVIINHIERETEKALLINCPVSWADNMHPKSLWFPKSCVEVGDKVMRVATFLVEKLSAANEYHGYRMYFEECK